jgi:hypothetical protein
VAFYEEPGEYNPESFERCPKSGALVVKMQVENARAKE